MNAVRSKPDSVSHRCPVRESVEVGATQSRNGASRYQRLSYLAVAFDTEPDDTYYIIAIKTALWQFSKKRLLCSSLWTPSKK